MQKLHLVGITTDQEGLILSVRRGARSGAYVLPVDDELERVLGELQAARSEAAAEEAEATVAAPAVVSALSVKEVQARLRRGHSVAQVAKSAGVEPEWVQRFAGPVLAECAQVATNVRSMALRRPRLGESKEPIGEAVRHHLADRGVSISAEEFDNAWSARQITDGRWVVKFGFRHRSRDQVLSFELDQSAGEVSTSDRLSSQMGYIAPDAEVPPPARKRTTAGSTGKTSASRARSATKGSTTKGSATKRSATKVVATKATSSRAAAAVQAKADAKRIREAERAAARRDKEKAAADARRARQAEAAQVAAQEQREAVAAARAEVERQREEKRLAAEEAQAEVVRQQEEQRRAAEAAAQATAEAARQQAEQRVAAQAKATAKPAKATKARATKARAKTPTAKAKPPKETVKPVNKRSAERVRAEVDRQRGAERRAVEQAEAAARKQRAERAREAAARQAARAAADERRGKAEANPEPPRAPRPQTMSVEDPVVPDEGRGGAQERYMPPADRPRFRPGLAEPTGNGHSPDATAPPGREGDSASRSPDRTPAPPARPRRLRPLRAT